MICKWCGAKIREKDRSCPRCGQELPPLSECGGFYDLVPGARQGVIPPVEPKSAVPPVPPVPPVNSSTGYYPPRKKKKNYGTFWLCVWAVLLLAVIALSVKSCSLSHELDVLDDRLSKVEKQSDKDATDDSEATGDGTMLTDSVKLSLNVTDNDGTIEKPDDDNWSCSKDSDDEDYYQVTYSGEPLIRLRCSLEEDLWKVETGSDISFQWQMSKDSGSTPDWSDLKAVELGGSSTCPEDGHDGDSKLRCILNWEQDEKTYEITIYFPSDPIRLTLKVTDEKGTIEIDESGESGDWEIDGHLLKYNGEKVFELYFTFKDENRWTSDIKNPLDNSILFYWEWFGTFADSDNYFKDEGLTSTCPVLVPVDQDDLYCILTWKQDDQNYEVTINFPPAQP